jgi:hypothetical protein
VLDAERQYHLSRQHTVADLLLQRVGEPLLHGTLAHYYATDRPPSAPYRLP